MFFVRVSITPLKSQGATTEATRQATFYRTGKTNLLWNSEYPYSLFQVKITKPQIWLELPHLRYQGRLARINQRKVFSQQVSAKELQMPAKTTVGLTDPTSVSPVEYLLDIELWIYWTWAGWMEHVTHIYILAKNCLAHCSGGVTQRVPDTVTSPLPAILLSTQFHIGLGSICT